MTLTTRLAYLFIRTLAFTYRYKFINTIELPEGKENYIFAIWHQNLVGVLTAYIGKKHCMIVSSSKDGALVADSCELMGHEPVRGSSTRGGTSALKGMIKKLRSGIPGAITVDGPKGPAKEAKKGIFELSYLTKTPIVPIMAYPSSFWEFSKSWDKFRIPRPFSTIHIHFGAALMPNSGDKENHFKQCVEQLGASLDQSEKYIHSLM